MKQARSLWLALWLFACSSPALAQEGAPASDADKSAAESRDADKSAAESRATAFEAVEGPQKEEVPGGTLLVVSYAFVMVLLIGYIARLGSLQNKTAAEVERLTRALTRGKPE